MVRQLGSAVLALVVMLVCATISDRFVPAVASEGTPATVAAHSGAGGGRVMAARASGVTPIDLHEPPSVAPRPPEQFVLLVAGLVLMGLGGALRTQRRGGR